MPKRIELDLNIAIRLSSQFIPVLISLPDLDKTFINVTHELIKHAKTIHDTKIIMITFDNGVSKLKRLHSALKEAIQKGYWIVIENAHALNEWPKEILNIIYVDLLNY